MARPTKLEREVAACGDLTRDELVRRWTDLYGSAPPAGVRNELLVRSAAWHLQANRLGGHSPAVQKQLRQAATRVLDRAENRSSPPTLSPDPGKTTKRPPLPAGSRIVRDWQGKQLVVDVVDCGYLFQGQVYNSLSAIASKVTGTVWSGPRFFGQ